jgi:MoaA/NifB/PqqE/SkfB family radical SAM enzyme
VNTVFIKGLNDGEIPEIAAAVKDAGADIMNIMQLIPVPHTLFESIPLISNASLNEMRSQCEAILPQMRHCRQCRADAIGTLDNDVSREFTETEKNFNADLTDKKQKSDENSRKTLLFAVASKSGVLVDEHFGHAAEFFIYERSGKRVSLKEKRVVPQFCGDDCGSGSHREEIFDILSDCTAVLVMRIGEMPRARFAERNIRVITTYDYIESAVLEAAE